MAALDRRDDAGKALTIASEIGNIMEMCRLINQGADVDYVLKSIVGGEEWSATPLTQAALMGHAEAVKVLISSNADVNKPEPCHGLTALHTAAENAHVPVMQLLISKGARSDVRDNLGQTPLHQAAGSGKIEGAICLLDHGAEVNAADKEGITPLIFAAQQKHIPLVDLLLIRGADPNLTSISALGTKGRTALHGASFDDDIAIAERLVEGGANVDQVDKKGVSPLHMAAQNGHLKVVKLLVRNGANIHQDNGQGLNPLHLATLHGRNEVVDYLIKKGANFDDQGNAVAKACKYCGATDVPTMMMCSGCRAVWYCGPVCQKKDWKVGDENRHKVQCPRIKEQRELCKEKKKEEAKMKLEQIIGQAQREY